MQISEGGGKSPRGAHLRNVSRTKSLCGFSRMRGILILTQDDRRHKDPMRDATHDPDAPSRHRARARSICPRTPSCGYVDPGRHDPEGIWSGPRQPRASTGAGRPARSPERGHVRSPADHRGKNRLSCAPSQSQYPMAHDRRVSTQAPTARPPPGARGRRGTRQKPDPGAQASDPTGCGERDLVFRQRLKAK
jgi:hypothetical protein